MKFLSTIESSWQHSLQQAKSEPAKAEQHLTQAITIASSFHPLFHFYESGLNTELAKLYIRQEKFEDAVAAARRAEFLDHENEPAKQILNGNYSILQEYTKAPLTTANWFANEQAGHLNLKEMSMFAAAFEAKQLASQSNFSKPEALYKQAIQETETAHQAYHKLAAKPWLARANYFQEIGEEELAKNDIRRARDLDADTKLEFAT